MLTVADLPVLDAAPREIQNGGFGSMGVLVDSMLVAIARTSVLTPRHADIGVATLEDWRGNGFATVAAALVAQQVQATGCTPVWSTGEDNVASQRVAQKLGFDEVGRRTYVVVEG